MSGTSTARNLGRPRNAFAKTGTNTVVALDRGLRTLEFLAETGGTTLTELARATDIPVATAHRILSTLEQRGMAEFSNTSQKWMVGTQAFRIGSAYLNRKSVVVVARPILSELTESTNETTNLAVEVDGNVVFLYQVESSNPIRAFFRTGSRGPMHSSGIGKVLLAFSSKYHLGRVLEQHGLPGFTPKTITDRDAFEHELSEIRERGWAFDDEERHLGMRCVAAPVYNAFGEVVAGISVSGPTSRFDDAHVNRLGELVKATAHEISEAFSGRVDP